jgi:sulfur-carrier protein adenylyltransferase/sulfurtransferase
LAGLADRRVVVTPMSELGQRGIGALPEAARDPGAEIYVMCHQGVRSSNVTGWLTSQGWTNVFSVAGGIAEYARRVDPGVGQY